MITEDYVSLEVAKLLKAKGFDEPVTTCYSNYNGLKPYTLINTGVASYKNSTEHSPFWISAPTLQMAMKWLREVHKLAIIISPQWAEGDMRNPCRWYWEIRGLENIDTDVYGNPTCDTYEEACEAAIKYSIENII